MASSDKRIAANRENARRSTGPRTEEGKGRSARNSFTHGMTSTAILLPDEDPEAYKAMVDSTLEDLHPESERERFLAINVANCAWRRQRMYHQEAAFFAMRTRMLRKQFPEEITTDAEARACILTDAVELGRVKLLLRYITAAERACEKANREFGEARKQRLDTQRATEEAQEADAEQADEIPPSQVSGLLDRFIAMKRAEKPGPPSLSRADLRLLDDEADDNDENDGDDLDEDALEEDDDAA